MEEEEEEEERGALGGSGCSCSFFLLLSSVFEVAGLPPIFLKSPTSERGKKNTDTA